jgi:hypothetical protein
MNGATRYGLLALAATAVVGLASAACGDALSASIDDAAEPTGRGPADGGGVSADSTGAGAPAPQQPSNGVMLVHAADFPALRVCFEGRPGARPIPDTTTMPDANIVGLDIGTGIRLAPIRNDRPLGKVFVIEVDPGRIRNGGFDENATCGELICEPGNGRCLTAGRDYATVSAPIGESALGVDKLTILAIKGCGNGYQIGAIGVTAGDCGPTWNNLLGNVSADLIGDLALEQRPAGVLPVQLVNLSKYLDPKTQGALTVHYGDLDAPDAGGAPEAGAPTLVEVIKDPAIDEPSPTKNLPLPAADETVYGKRGFVIERKTGAGNAFALRTSLADVQENSSPLSLPAEYYAGSSKYALLLLGDPRAQTPGDPRRVHLIAVPMTDPADATETDADAGAATAGDASTGSGP